MKKEMQEDGGRSLHFKTSKGLHKPFLKVSQKRLDGSSELNQLTSSTSILKDKDAEQV